MPHTTTQRNVENFSALSPLLNYLHTVDHKGGMKYFSTISWDISCSGSYFGCLGCIPLQCWVDQSLLNIPSRAISIATYAIMNEH